MAQSNGTVDSRIIWWVLGIAGSVALILLTFLINRLEDMNRRIAANAVAIASIQQQSKQLETVLELVRDDHVAKLLGLLEQQMKREEGR